MSSILSHSQTPSSTSFTCNSCSIRLPTADLQRLHMKTDWHRYNLKRRVAQLPLISSDLFAEKFSLSQNVEDNEDEYGFRIYSKLKSSNDKQLTKKDLKRQQKALSRGRNNLIVGMEDGVDVTRNLSPVSVTASEFSNFSLAESLSGTHNTDTDYETQSESYVYNSEDDLLDSDLSLATEEDDEDDETADEEEEEEEDSIPLTECFFCGVDSKEIGKNVDHMFKNHGLYIPDKEHLSDIEGLLEFLSEIIALGHECLVCGFFGKNLESIRLHMRAKGHCTLPYESKEDRELFQRFYQAAAAVDSGDDEEEVESAEIDESGTELILPNGSRLGHRSMSRYYRQNIVSLDVVPATEGQQTLLLVDRRLKSGLTLKEVIREDKRIQQQEQKAKNAYERRNFRSTNINFQKHFRDELLQ